MLSCQCGVKQKFKQNKCDCDSIKFTVTTLPYSFTVLSAQHKFTVQHKAIQVYTPPKQHGTSGGTGTDYSLRRGWGCSASMSETFSGVKQKLKQNKCLILSDFVLSDTLSDKRFTRLTSELILLFKISQIVDKASTRAEFNNIKIPVNQE